MLSAYFSFNWRSYIGLFCCTTLVVGAIVYDRMAQHKRELPVAPVVTVIKHNKVEKIELHPVRNVLQHTNFVGTADNPTIDGGIINNTDGLPVSAFAAKENAPATQHMDGANGNLGQIQDKPKTNLGQPPTNRQQSDNKVATIADDWATSQRVKSLLKSAASDGKLDYVLQKIDEKGLPVSVATVPMIESSYQENATSPKGAAGAWQLMPQTAQDYGVSKDERYKLNLATEAALNLLYNLHQEFHSWELAFAAYNAGAARVAAAVRKNPQAKSVQELDLPQETKDYVKRIMALNKTLAGLS